MSTKYAVTEKTSGEIVGVRLVQNHGRVQIPKTVRDRLHLRDGDAVYWVFDDGNICLRRATKT